MVGFRVVGVSRVGEGLVVVGWRGSLGVVGVKGWWSLGGMGSRSGGFQGWWGLTEWWGLEHGEVQGWLDQEAGGV